eukprot:2711245-Alexandrium_andersonii.AAC.1
MQTWATEVATVAHECARAATEAQRVFSLAVTVGRFPGWGGLQAQLLSEAAWWRAEARWHATTIEFLIRGWAHGCG